MGYRDVINKIISKGQEEFEDLEIFSINNKEIQIGIYDGEIDKYSISESGGLSLRGISNGKMGYSYTEKIDESSIDMLISQAVENGKYIETTDKESIFKGSDKYKEVNTYDINMAKVPTETKIEFLRNLEKEAKSLDSRVVSVNLCMYQEFEQERYIVNTKGINLNDKSNNALSYISVVVKEDEDTKTGYSYRIFKDISSMDYREMAKEAVEMAISMLNAKSIESNNYPVVFKNSTFADLLSAFSPIFSAENVQKDLSLLKDKLGEEVGSSILNIVDNPFLEDGFKSRSFDDEGTKSISKKVIDNGILKSYLYNWKTANKDGVESTGNGNRGSYKGSLSIAPTNLYIEKGNMELKDIIGSVDKGLYIVNLEGLHSGLNPVSGDFSLSAYGYEILEGKIHRPVNQITIAGNLFQVFKDIQAIGNDLDFSLPSSGYIGSPSIKVKSISVAGE